MRNPPTPRNRSLRGAQLGAWLALGWFGTAEARVWYIEPDGTGDAPTVQAGIDSAEVGDVVLLAPGIYTWTSQGASGYSMLRMKAGVTLRGKLGAPATILDAETQGRVLRCDNVGAQTLIEGLTFQNGNARFELGGPVGTRGGGIYVSGDSEPAIRDCVFQNNVSGGAGGNGSGGAIRCDVATIERCVFVNNGAFSSGEGGAISCAAARITDCVFEGNRTGGDPGSNGGAIGSAGATILGCVFRNNTAGGFRWSGGGAVYECAGGTITSCVFDGNKVTAADEDCSGGAVTVCGTISDCVFTNNVAEASFFAVARGGAVGASLATITRCIFIGNVARHRNPDGPGYGGAIESFSGNLLIENCTMVGNSGGSADGVGGIFALGAGNGISITSTIVANNLGRACGGAGAAGITWSCNDVFGNSDNSLCGTDGGGNISADPQFCDTDPVSSLNVSIQKDSPCASGNHPTGASCGLVGAAPVNCGAVTVESKTWSTVKGLYRD